MKFNIVTFLLLVLLLPGLAFASHSIKELHSHDFQATHSIYNVSDMTGSGDLNWTGSILLNGSPVGQGSGSGSGNIISIQDQDDYIVVANGTVTNITLNETKLNATIDARDSDTTYTAGNGLTLSSTEFSINANTCSSGQASYWDGNSWECRSLSSGNVTGGGNVNKLAIWINGTDIGSSSITDDGSTVTVASRDILLSTSQHVYFGSTDEFIRDSATTADIDFSSRSGFRWWLDSNANSDEKFVVYGDSSYGTTTNPIFHLDDDGPLCLGCTDTDWHFQISDTDPIIALLEVTDARGQTVYRASRGSDGKDQAGLLLQTNQTDNWYIGLPYNGGAVTTGLCIGNTTNKADCFIYVDDNKNYGFFDTGPDARWELSLDGDTVDAFMISSDDANNGDILHIESDFDFDFAEGLMFLDYSTKWWGLNDTTPSYPFDAKVRNLRFQGISNEVTLLFGTDGNDYCEKVEDSPDRIKCFVDDGQALTLEPTSFGIFVADPTGFEVNLSSTFHEGVTIVSGENLSVGTSDTAQEVSLAGDRAKFEYDGSDTKLYAGSAKGYAVYVNGSGTYAYRVDADGDFHIDAEGFTYDASTNSAAVNASVSPGNAFTVGGNLNVTGRIHGTINRSDIDSWFQDCPTNSYRSGENQTVSKCVYHNYSNYADGVLNLSFLETGTAGYVVTMVNGTPAWAANDAEGSGTNDTYAPNQTNGSAVGWNTTIDEDFTGGSQSICTGGNHNTADDVYESNGDFGTIQCGSGLTDANVEAFWVNITNFSYEDDTNDPKFYIYGTASDNDYLLFDGTHAAQSWKHVVDGGGFATGSCSSQTWTQGDNISIWVNKTSLQWKTYHNGVLCHTVTSAALAGSDDFEMNSANSHEINMSQFTIATYNTGTSAGYSDAAAGFDADTHHFVFGNWADNSSRPSDPDYPGFCGWNRAATGIDCYDNGTWYQHIGVS